MFHRIPIGENVGFHYIVSRTAYRKNTGILDTDVPCLSAFNPTYGYFGFYYPTHVK